MPASVKRPERELKTAILTLLRAHGIAAWATGVGAFPASYQGRQRFVRVGTKGMSDIVACVPWCTIGSRPARSCGATGHPVGEQAHTGRLCCIEVKLPGGRIRPEQTAFLQTVVRAGGIGFVAHSIDEVKERLGL